MPVVCIAEKSETFIIVTRLLREPTAFQLFTSTLSSRFDYADMVKRSLDGGVLTLTRSAGCADSVAVAAQQLERGTPTTSPVTALSVKSRTAGAQLAKSASSCGRIKKKRIARHQHLSWARVGLYCPEVTDACSS